MQEKFRELFKLTTEAGKDPKHITWNKKPTKWTGHFELENIPFEIVIAVNNDYKELCKSNDSNESTEIWEFKFYRDNKTAMPNDFKYPFKVSATIKKAMEDFLSQKKPNVIGFVGNKEDKGRVKMYEKYAKVYSSKFDYAINVNKDSDFYAFILYKNNDFKECIDEMIKSKG